MNRLTDDQRRLVEKHYATAVINAKVESKRTRVPFDVALSGVCVGFMDAATRYDASRGGFLALARKRASGQLRDDGRLHCRWTCGARYNQFQPESNAGPSLDKDDRPRNTVDDLDAFNRLLKGLEPRFVLMMKLIYIEGMNQHQVGKVIGVTESRVSQMHSEAKAAIKGRLTR